MYIVNISVVIFAGILIFIVASIFYAVLDLGLALWSQHY